MAIAMEGGQPDRVPVMSQLALGHYFLNAGIDPVEIWFTSEGFAQALVSLQQRYAFDGILINLPGRQPDLLDRIVERSSTQDGERLVFDTGEIVVVPPNDNAIYYPGDSGRKERFDFEADPIELLDSAEDFGGYVWGTYHVPWLDGRRDRGLLTDVPDYMFSTIDQVRDLTDGEVSVHGECFSPFTHYMELVGYELALLSLLLNPDKAHALLDRLCVASVAWAVAQAERGVDAVLMSSAFAGGPMVSPAMYEQFVLPYELRVTAAVSAATDVPVYTHTCGSIGDRLELMTKTGTKGIDTLDPPPLGTVELRDAKNRIGDKVFIKGNMDPVLLLQSSERDAIVEHATDRISSGAPGGGYILSTACSVAPAVEPWKLELLTALADQIGRYDSLPAR